MIALCKSVEVLKALEATFHRHSLAIVSLVGHICQKLASSIILTIGKAKVLMNAISDRENHLHFGSKKMKALKSCFNKE